nr:ADM_HP1_G0046440.mRNA.1.CDS.1 [Saccharomyces cerevisiae]
MYPQQRLQPKQHQPQQQYHQYNLYQRTTPAGPDPSNVIYKAILISTLPQTNATAREIRVPAVGLLESFYQPKEPDNTG